MSVIGVLTSSTENNVRPAGAWKYSGTFRCWVGCVLTGSEGLIYMRPTSDARILEAREFSLNIPLLRDTLFG